MSQGVTQWREGILCPYCGSRDFKVMKSVMFRSTISRVYVCTCNMCKRTFLFHVDKHRAFTVEIDAVQLKGEPSID